MKLTPRERLIGESQRIDDLLRVTADAGWNEFLYRLGEISGRTTFKKVEDVQGAIATSPVASRAVDMVAESISLLPVRLYKEDEEIDKGYDELMRIFKIPNPEDLNFTWRLFMEATVKDWMTYGRWLWLRDMGRASGQVKALAWLDAAPVKIKTTEKTKGTFDAFKPRITAIEYNNSPLDLDYVIYCYRHTARSKYQGESPIQSALDSAAGNAAMIRSMKSLFENRGLPNVQLIMDANYDMSDTKKEEYRRKWKNKHQGPDKTGGIVFPPRGTKFEPLQISNKDAEYSLALEFNNKAIAISAGIPWIILAAGDATYENQDAAKAFMWNTTLLPLCRKIEEALTVYVAWTWDEKLEVRFDYEDVEELLRKVQKATDSAKQAIGLRLKEIRKLYPGDYEELGIDADELILTPSGFKNPENMGVMPSFTPNEPPANEPPPIEDQEEKGLFGKMTRARKDKQDKDYQRRVTLARSELRLQEYEYELTRELGKLWRKQMTAVDDALQKQQLDDELNGLKPVRSWIDWDKEKHKFITATKPILKRAIIRAGAEVMASQGRLGKDAGFKFTEQIETKLSITVTKFVHDAIDNTIKYLEKAVNKSDVVERFLRQQGEEIEEKETKKEKLFALVGGLYMIAQGTSAEREGATYAHWGGEYGNFEGMRQSDMNTKTWLTMMDGHERASHAAIDGETVPLNGLFSNGLAYPGDPSGASEEIFGCRCSMQGGQ